MLLKNCRLVLLIFIIAGLRCAPLSPRLPAVPPTLPICIIPYPRQVQLRPLDKRAPCLLDQDFVILLESTHNPSDLYSAELLKEEIKNLSGLDLRIVVDDPAIRKQDKVILLGIPKRDKEINYRASFDGIFAQKWLGEQGYVVDIEQTQVIVLANHSTGLFYAVQTLRQLLAKQIDEVLLPALTIRDTPVYLYRGIQIDITHNPLPTMEYLKQVMETLSFYKYNFLSLYIEHTFAFQKHPEIVPPEALTPAEIEELSRYARQHHMMLIGNQQSLGHLQGFLSHPDYRNLAENPEHPRTLSIVNEGSYELLHGLYEEVVPLYPAEFFHINCDEPVGLGRCATAKLALRESHGGIWLRHINRLYRMLEPYQKRLMVWGDMPLKHQRILAKLPRDIIIMNRAFTPQDSYTDLLEPIKKAGLTQFVCPNTASTFQVFPVLPDAIKNIKNLIRDGVKAKALGMMLCCAWQGDGAGFIEAEWYPIAWASECAWLPRQINETRFQDNFIHAFYGRGEKEGVELMELLSRPAELLNTPDNMNTIFWEDPFQSRFHLSVSNFSEHLSEIESDMERAMTLLKQLRNKARRHKANLDYLSYSVHCWQYLVKRFRLTRLIMEKYCYTYNKLRDQPDLALKRLKEIQGPLTELSKTLTSLQAEYLALREKTYRGYLKKKNLSRFETLLSLYHTKKDQLARTITEYMFGFKLPPPETFDFQAKRLPERAVKPARLPAGTEITKIPIWWDRRWHYRVLIHLTNPQDKLVDYPVEIILNFSGLLQEKGLKPQRFDPVSIRVIEYTPATGAPSAGVSPGTELSCQFEPDQDFNLAYNAVGRLIWIAQGNWLPGTDRSFYIYFNTGKTGKKKPLGYQAKGVRTYEGKAGTKWIENNRMKVCLSPIGASIIEWEIKKSGEELIRYKPGQGRAYLQMPSYQDKRFSLVCEAQGPMLVRYRAVASEGSDYIINCYHNLPLVEVIMNSATYGFHNKAAPETMKEPRAGARYIFSNYFTGQLPGPNEPPVTEPATYWSAKLRQDGLTITCLTPDNKVSHYIGRSEFGIKEKETPISHFLIFADILPAGVFLHPTGPFRLFNQLRTTFSLLEAPQVSRGWLETAP